MGRVRLFIKKGKNVNSWSIDFRDNNGRHRPVIGHLDSMTKYEAEKMRVKKEHELYFEKAGIPIQKEISTKELFEQFKSHKQRQVSESTMLNINSKLNFWFKLHKSGKFYALQLQEINKIVNNMELSPAVINQYLYILNQFYKYAISLNIIQDNPVKSIGKFKEIPRKVSRFFSKEEVQTIMNLCSDFYRDLFTFMLYTGMRKDDIRFLKWENIDLDNEIIKFQSRKTGAPQSIHIHSKVRKVLTIRLQGPKSEYIFCNEDGTVFSGHTWYNYFKRLLKRAGIPNASLHTWRHTFASWLAMEGVDLLRISKLLGHKDIKTTQIYAHLSPGYTKESINKLWSYKEN